MSDAILESYSQQAVAYDLDANQDSCWGRLGREAYESLSIEPGRRCVVDVGCGTGRALEHLACRLPPQTKLLGIDPAPGMCELARERTAGFPNVRIMDGRFEAIPAANKSIDHLFSIHAFHWVGSVDRALTELRRVLTADADLDVFFAGRGTGPEFVAATSPILRRYLGFADWLMSAKLRVQLGPDEALEVFRRGLPEHEVHAHEQVETHYDTLDGHWSWWLRIEGHFTRIERSKRAKCFAEVRKALAKLETGAGIPYTTRILHVSTRPPASSR
jgi:ubiquinone/menaquinone biosynthesis C-methylase UbiE